MYNNLVIYSFVSCSGVLLSFLYCFSSKEEKSEVVQVENDEKKKRSVPIRKEITSTIGRVVVQSSETLAADLRLLPHVLEAVQLLLMKQ